MPIAKDERGLLLNPVVIPVVEHTIGQDGTRTAVLPAEIVVTAPALVGRHIEIRTRRDARCNIIVERLLNPKAILAVIARRRKVPLHGACHIDHIPLLLENNLVLDPELYIREHKFVAGIELRHIRAQVVVRSFGGALRLRTVIHHDLVRVELESFARHIVAADLALGIRHRAFMRLVVVVDAIAVERHAWCALRQLQYMRTIRDRDRARDRIPLYIVALKTPCLKLHNVHMSLCRKVTRALVIGQIVPLERDRRRRVRRHGMAQMLRHRLHIREQRLLLLRETVRTLLPPLVFYEVQMLKPGICVPAIGGINAARQHGTGSGQCK